MIDSLPLDFNQLTWAVLLGRWVEFAKSAIALPKTEDGQRMRDSVADVIMLQAVWFSLREIDQLAHDEKQLGLDRAQILIEKHTAAIRSRWRNTLIPDAMIELIDDAASQLENAQKTHS